MPEDTIEKSDAQAIIETALESAEPKELDLEATYLTVVPEGAIAEIHNLERYRSQPSRKRGNVELHDAASLGKYVNEHDDKSGSTALYADVYERRIVAVINGHAPAADGADGEPGWGDHCGRLQLRPTPEWLAWANLDGKLVDQVRFAEHIEDRLDDIRTPSGADVLELAKTFEAKVGVEFESAIVLESGQRQLTYKETIAARAGAAGQITIPKEITLGIKPFEGSDAYAIRARLRYRINAGALTIGIQLVKAEDVLRDAVNDTVATIESDTGLVAFSGTPASSVS